MILFKYARKIIKQVIVWQHPDDVDYKVMAMFVEFYNTLLGFVNFRLFHSLNLHYPPKVCLCNSFKGIVMLLRKR